MRESIVVTEVGPRDGLQSLPQTLPVRDRVALVRALATAGLRSIEIGSFVSSSAVAQMVNTDAVLAQIGDITGLRASVLVPTRRRLDLAQAAGAKEIAVVVAATDTMNRRNIGMSLAEAIEEGRLTVRQARSAGIATRAYVAVAFECPFEGTVELDDALEVAARLDDAGAQEIILADTIGAAGPRQVQQAFTAAARIVPAARLAAHFHDTRGLGAANAWAAMEAGVRRFDSSLGGLGGCPFAPGAAGNLATEDLVLLAEQAGFDTGVDIGRLAAAIRMMQAVTGKALGGRSMAWLELALESGLIQQETQ